MLDHVLSSVEKGISTVGETLTKPMETEAGEVLKAGESLIEGGPSKLIQTEISALDPFTVATGATTGLVGTLEGRLSSILKNPFTDITKLMGDGSLGDLGGSSIEAVLLKLAEKERGSLADKVNQLKNLQVPGQGATPQQQADYDSQKVNLMADIQSIQNSIQQITTMATNVQKNENDTNMSIVRNMA
jgi:hypothetical protein